MPDVFILNTAAEVEDEFLVRRDQPQTFTVPQTFPSGTVIAPGIVVGAAGVGLLEDSGELHYAVGGVDRGELIGKNEVAAPGVILGQLVFWNQNILRWQQTPNRLVSDDGSQLQPVAGITGPVVFDGPLSGISALESDGLIDGGAEVHAQRLEVGPGPEFDAFFAGGLPLVGYQGLEARFGGVQTAGFTQVALYADGLRGLLIDTNQEGFFDVSASAPFFRAGGSVATAGEFRLGPAGQLVGTNGAQDANIVVAGVAADVVQLGDAARALALRGTAHGFFGSAPVAQPDGVGAIAVLESLGLAVNVPVPVVNFTDLTGVIADGQVPESAVTQHQAALAIDYAQLFGAQPAPIGHAATHELGGSDVLTIDWSQLDNVPAEFPPELHTHTYLVGNQTNLAPPAGSLEQDVSGVQYLRVNTAAGAVELTGMSGGQRGQNVVIQNATGGNPITVKHNDVTVDPTFRITLTGGVDVTILEGESLEVSYDGTSGLWRQMFTVPVAIVNSEYRFETISNGVQLVDLGGGDSRQLNGIGRINMSAHEGGNASSVAWANGNEPNFGGSGIRSYAATDGRRHLISFVSPGNSREAYQTAAFLDEEQGVAETPRDYALQEIFRLQDEVAAIYATLAALAVPIVVPVIPDPYAAQSARTRRAPVGSIP